jgi:hypothetical protein
MTSLVYIQDQVPRESYFLQGPCFYGQRRLCLALCILSSLYASMALYFYGPSKKSLHKSRATFGNMLFQQVMGLIIIHNFYFYNFYLKLAYISKNLTFCINIVLFLKSSLYQSMIVKIAHLQNKTFTY